MAERGDPSMAELSDATKERVKLRSTYLNNIAVGIMLLGTVSTVLSLATGGQPGTGNLVLSIAAVCVAVSLLLHVLAVRWLGDLNNDV